MSQSGQSLVVLGDLVTVLADREETGGAYSVCEVVVQPESPGPPPHLHTNCEETFIVISGRLGVRLGDRRLELGPRESGCAARGVVHT